MKTYTKKQKQLGILEGIAAISIVFFIAVFILTVVKPLIF